MQPALQPGDVILADRGERGAAQRGDIVVLDGSGFFAPSADSDGKFWVKRVIATGGERVACCDEQGRLTIDGTALSEPYLPDTVAPSTDRKSTRLNSSHVAISYAVLGLKETNVLNSG